MFIFPVLLIVFFSFAVSPEKVMAEENEEVSVHEERMALFKKTEALTQIPWYYFAAIENYERNINKEEDEEEVINIEFEPEAWFGAGNVSMLSDEYVITVH